MADPIEAHYTPDGDDWTVAVTGRGRTLTGRAPGLIAARDRADQLVEQLAPEEPGHKTVVHMLNGDAVDFTTAYLTARLARTEEPTDQAPADEKPAEAPANEKAPTEPTDGEAPTAGKAPVAGPAAPAGGQTPAGGKASTDGNAAANRPVPANTAAGDRPAGAKPTPFPRTESEAATPAAHPPAADAQKEESATSGS